MGSPNCACAEAKWWCPNLYGDYKLTANGVAKLDTYLLPRIEDFFISIRGKYFSKSDLPQAYLQLPLGETSSLSTHRKDNTNIPDFHLEWPLHHQYFRATIDNLLQGIAKIRIYLDHWGN